MIGDKKQAAQWFQWLRGHPAWVVLGLTLLFVAVVRMHLLRMPLERDEGEYAYAGQLILHGVPPYKAAYNMKLPGTYAAYALIMAVFGQSPAGIHFGLLLVNAASIVLMFLLGRRLLDEAAGAAAAVSFALLSLSPSVLGLAGHATHFVVLPALAGTLMLVSSLKSQVSSLKSQVSGLKSQVSGRRGTAEYAKYAEGETVAKADAQRRTRGYPLSTLNYPLFAAGLLFGVAFLMKQHGLFFGVFAGLYLVWSRVAQIREREEQSQVSGLKPKASSLKSAGRAPFKASTSTGTAGVRPPSPAPARATGPRLSHFAAAKLKAGDLTAKNAEGEEVGKAEGQRLKAEVQSPESNVQSLKAEGSGVAAGDATRNTQDAAAFDAEYTEGESLQPPRSNAPALQVPTYGSLVVELALLTAGFALPYLVTCLVLWGAGVFPQFWFWTVSYAREYASGNSLVNGPDLLKVALRSAVGPNLIFWLLPWAGALVMWWEERWAGGGKRMEDRGRRKENGKAPSSTFHPLSSPRFFLLALLFCSFAAASVGLYFREHYFILVLPVLCLLTGVAVSRGLYLVKYDRTIELFLGVPVLLAFVLGAGAALIGDGSVWFASSPEVAHRRVYHTTLFIEAAKLAETIKANTPQDARVTVLGSEPEVYFLSDRRSATGYIYTYPLMDNQPYAVRMQGEMIKEIEHGKPEYVVYVADDFSWLRYAQSPRGIDDWWKDYWPSHFDLVSTIKISEDLDVAIDPRTSLPVIPEPTPVGTSGLESLGKSGGADAAVPEKRLILLKRRS